MASVASGPARLLLVGLFLVLAAVCVHCKDEDDDLEYTWDGWSRNGRDMDEGASVAKVWLAIMCAVTGFFFFTDLPTISNQARRYLSLFSINIACLVFWAVIFGVMLLEPTMPQAVVAGCFAGAHMGVCCLFRAKFRKHGQPTYLVQETEMTSQPHGPHPAALSSAQGGRNSPSVVGMPVYDIPMATVIIGDGNSAPGQYSGAHCQPQYPPGAFPPAGQAYCYPGAVMDGAGQPMQLPGQQQYAGSSSYQPFAQQSAGSVVPPHVYAAFGAMPNQGK